MIIHKEQIVEVTRIERPDRNRLMRHPRRHIRRISPATPTSGTRTTGTSDPTTTHHPYQTRSPESHPHTDDESQTPTPSPAQSSSATRSSSTHSPTTSTTHPPSRHRSRPGILTRPIRHPPTYAEKSTAPARRRPTVVITTFENTDTAFDGHAVVIIRKEQIVEVTRIERPDRNRIMRHPRRHIRRIILQPPHLGPEQLERPIRRDHIIRIKPDPMNLTLHRRREVKLQHRPRRQSSSATRSSSTHSPTTATTPHHPTPQPTRHPAPPHTTPPRTPRNQPHTPAAAQPPHAPSASPYPPDSPPHPQRRTSPDTHQEPTVSTPDIINIDQPRNINTTRIIRRRRTQLHILITHRDHLRIRTQQT